MEWGRWSVCGTSLWLGIRQRIARALKLASLDKLVANYRITSISGGGWRLAGHLEADVVQSCIVSLEPVPAHIASKANNSGSQARNKFHARKP